jgi:hypothetical protein
MSSARLVSVLAAGAVALHACGGNQSRSDDEAPARSASPTTEPASEESETEPRPSEPAVVIAARDEDRMTLVVGDGHSCACVRAAGRVSCWGNSFAGQCGVREDYVESPAEVF